MYSPAFPTANEIWHLIDREFKKTQIEQFPARRQFLQALDHLSVGNQLVVMLGDAGPTVWFDGKYDVRVFAGILFSYRYVEISGFTEDASMVYFRLSKAGANKLMQGRQWWRSLNFWERIKVRLFCQ